MPIWPPPCAMKCRTLWRATTTKARRGKIGFSGSLDPRARSRARQTGGPRAICKTVSPISSSMSFRIPIRCRPRSCCCSPRTTRGNRTGCRSRPKPGKLFVVGDPKQSVYKFRRATVLYRSIRDTLVSRGVGALASRQLPRRAPIQHFVNTAFHSEMPATRRPGKPTYPPLIRQHAAHRGQPNVIALPVPRPYSSQRVSKISIDRSCRTLSWHSSSGWSARAAGRCAIRKIHQLLPVAERYRHSLPPPHPMAATSRAITSGRWRIAGPAPPGGFEIVSQPRGSGNSARRAHRHRMAGRRAIAFATLKGSLFALTG